MIEKRLRFLLFVTTRIIFRLALLTTSSSSSFTVPYMCVFWCELVTIFAMGSYSFVLSSTVNQMCYKFKMFWSNTRFVSTQVVWFHSIRNRFSIMQFIRKSVGSDGTTIVVSKTVVPFMFTVTKNPARSKFWFVLRNRTVLVNQFPKSLNSRFWLSGMVTLLRTKLWVDNRLCFVELSTTIKTGITCLPTTMHPNTLKRTEQFLAAA